MDIQYFVKKQSAAKKYGTAVFTITPKDAINILGSQQHKNYRTLRPKVRDAYVRMIECGEWIGVANDICFDWNGEMIDGQHRLAAIVKANASVQMSIKAGLPPEAKPVIDCGPSRSAGDAAAWFLNVNKNRNLFAAVIKQFWTLPNVNGARPIYRNSELEGLYNRAKNSIDFVINCFPVRRKSVTRVPCIVAFARAHHYCPHNAERLSMAAASLYSQDFSLPHMGPIRLLSVYLSNLDGPSTSLRCREQYLKTATAIKHMFDGKKTSTLKVMSTSADPFPVDFEEVL